MNGISPEKPTDEQRAAIAAAAKELDQLRNNWLNPPEWVREEILEFAGSADGPWRRYIDPATITGSPTRERGSVDDGADSPSLTRRASIGIVRYPRLVAKDADCAKKLAKRTLTNLYNERPTWLDLAHRALDTAVAAAYGWPADLSDDEILARLLTLNLERAQQ